MKIHRNSPKFIQKRGWEPQIQQNLLKFTQNSLKFSKIHPKRHQGTPKFTKCHQISPKFTQKWSGEPQNSPKFNKIHPKKSLEPQKSQKFTKKGLGNLKSSWESQISPEIHPEKELGTPKVTKIHQNSQKFIQKWGWEP